jgi:hypothetical protein
MARAQLQIADAIRERSEAATRRRLARKRAVSESHAFRASRRGSLLMAAIGVIVAASSGIYALQNSSHWFLRVLGALLAGVIAVGAFYVVVVLVNWIRAPYQMLKEEASKLSTAETALAVANELINNEREAAKSKLLFEQNLRSQAYADRSTARADLEASRVRLDALGTLGEKLAAENESLRRKLTPKSAIADCMRKLEEHTEIVGNHRFSGLWALAVLQDHTDSAGHMSAQTLLESTLKWSELPLSTVNMDNARPQAESLFRSIPRTCLGSVGAERGLAYGISHFGRDVLWWSALLEVKTHPIPTC